MDDTTPASFLRKLSELQIAPRFATLGVPWVTPVQPTPLKAPRLIAFSEEAARTIGLDPAEASNPQLLALLNGEHPLPGYAPLASVYGGHQFGTWAGQLGDGRALLIGEVETPDGVWEMQLKGAGQTPYSRFADGRAVLRSTVREFLCSEAMHGLGIPTTRALAIVGSDEIVLRETPEQGAILCRLAPTHLRFGHFEFFYYNGQHHRLQPLADFVIRNHYPQFIGRPDAIERWLETLIAQTAKLVAQWMHVGFCHGVMNTDNFSAIGLTIDYGPFGFMDGFNARHICNHSDDSGRYAYAAQPNVAHWNLARLLNACLPLLDDEMEKAVERANALLAAYPALYNSFASAGWGAKLGFAEARDEDRSLIDDWVALLNNGHSDFTRSFRALGRIRSDAPETVSELRDELLDRPGFDAWLPRYLARLARENRDPDQRQAAMNAVNPKYVLRNHLAQRAIGQAEHGDATEIDRLLKLLTRPYDEQPEFEAYAAEPPAELRHIEVSCSS